MVSTSIAPLTQFFLYEFFNLFNKSYSSWQHEDFMRFFLGEGGRLKTVTGYNNYGEIR